MKTSELLTFSRLLNDGLEKQAMGAAIGGAMRGLGRGMGSFAGHGANFGEGAAHGMGQAAGWTANQLTKERHLPNMGLMKGVREGYYQARPGAVAGEAHGPAMPPGYLKPEIGTSRTGANDWAAMDPKWNQLRAGATTPAPMNPNPVAAAPPVGAPPTPVPQAAVPGGGVYDRFKTQWAGMKPWQKGLAGYGAATAITTPANIDNNMHANWQRQHPIQSWLGQTFAGMPQYQSKSYLTPSFM